MRFNTAESICFRFKSKEAGLSSELKGLLVVQHESYFTFRVSFYIVLNQPIKKQNIKNYIDTTSYYMIVPLRLIDMSVL